MSTIVTETPARRIRAWIGTRPGPATAVAELLATGLGPATLDAMLAGSLVIAGADAYRISSVTGIPVTDLLAYQQADWDD